MRWRWCAGDACLTYGGLVERAGRLAGYLRQAGVGAGVGGGVVPGRGARSMVAAVLAVWLAGAAYLPLDPAYPAARLAFMLADSRASVLVATGRAAAGRSLPAGVRVVRLDDPVGAGADRGGRPPAVPVPVVAGAAGVRDLHVGVDGGAEGGAGHVMAGW